MANDPLHDGVEQYLPTKGWLGLFMRFTSNLEICPRFRFFSACCCLGAAVNNKAWIQRGDEGLLPKLFPNVWVILLAPPGRGHKNTSINIPVNALQAAFPEVRILADKLTPEYLVKGLSAPATAKDIIRMGPSDATGLIKAPELSVFFGKQKYNVGLINLITDLYDFREVWKGGTIGRGGEELHNVCISILGGSTPSWLQQMLPEDAFTGGFMSRFVIVEMPATYFKKITHPRKPKDMEWDHVVEGLAELASSANGEFRWGKDSLDAYESVYDETQPTGDIQRDAYREREAEQILRLGMLLAINNKRLDLTGKDIHQARNIVAVLRQEIDPRIAHLTTNPRMSLVQDIQDLLRMHGSLTDGELLKMCYRQLTYGEKQFYEAIAILRKTRIIEATKKGQDFLLNIREVFHVD